MVKDEEKTIIADFQGVDPTSIIPAAKGVETSLHTYLIYTRKLFLLLLAFVVLPLAAQTGLGVVHGTVQDASKAVIPNAKVTLTHNETGVARSTDTNASGIYYFGAVPIGPHTLVVESSGFKKWESTLTIQAGQTVVIDPAMEVGSLEATVEVTGAAPVVTTQGAQVSDTKDALRIHNLPLNGRQITNLFDLTPGVEGGGNPRVNGMKVGSTEMLFDGISYVDRFGGGISRVQPGWIQFRNSASRLPALARSFRVRPRSSWSPGVAPTRFMVLCSRPIAATPPACGPGSGRTAIPPPS